jgi:hypothetical protein
MDGSISETLEDYAALASTAFEQYSAYTFIEQSNKENNGSILNGLSTQYSLGNHQYLNCLRISESQMKHCHFQLTVVLLSVIKLQTQIIQDKHTSIKWNGIHSEYEST